MAVQAGSLFVDLTANSAAFMLDMRRASGAVNSNTARMNRSLAAFDRQMRDVQRRISLGATALVGSLAAATFGAGGLGKAIKDAVGEADTIGKVADKVGVTTDELQELRFAASQSGVATNTLDLALQRFSRRVGEARQGSGELKDTLKQYNIELEDSTGGTRGNVAILKDLAQAIQGAGSQQERLRIAFKAFDSEGAALVNLMREGAAGIEGFARQAQELGIVLDRDMVRRAEETNDKLDVMRRIVDTRLSEALLNLTPLIEAGAKTIVNFAEAINQVVIAVSDVEALSMRNLKGELEEARSRAFALAEALADVDSRMGAVRIDAGRGVESFSVAAAEAELERVNKRFEELNAEIQRREAARGEVVTIGGGGGGGGSDGDDTKDKGKKFDDLSASVRKATEEAQAHEQAMRRASEGALALVAADVRLANEITALVETPLAKFNREQATLNRLHDEGRIATEVYEERLKQMRAELARSDPLFGALENSAFRLGDALFEAGLGGERALESLRDTAVSVVNDIARQFFRLKVIEPLLQGLFGSSGGGNLFNFGASPGGTPGTLTATQQANFPAGGFQRGGAFTVGGVGGADSVGVAFRATPGERVTIETPAQQRGGGGAVTITQNFDFRGAAPGTAAQLRAVSERLKEETISEVETRMNRGGSLARASGRRR